MKIFVKFILIALSILALNAGSREELCEKGDKGWCFHAAGKYDEGSSERKKYLEKSCDLDYAIGCNELANYYLNKKIITKAKKFYKKACDLNYNQSCVLLGGLFESEGNCDEALKIYAATYENKKYELANKKYKELLGNPKCSIINDEEEQNFLKKDQIWIGEYACNQGQTDLTLEITDVEYNNFSAIFKFYHKKSKTEGSYSVTGSIRGNIMETRLNEWIKRPSGYSAVNIVGVYDPYNKEISGHVTSKGCEYFRIKLTEEVTKKNQSDCELGNARSCVKLADEFLKPTEPNVSQQELKIRKKSGFSHDIGKAIGYLKNGCELGERDCITSLFCEDYIEESCTKLANIYLGTSELLDEDARATYTNVDEAVKYMQKTYYLKRNGCDDTCNAEIAAAYLSIAKDAQKAKNYAITSCDKASGYCHNLAKEFEKLGDRDTAKELAIMGCNKNDKDSCRFYKKNYN